MIKCRGADTYEHLPALRFRQRVISKPQHFGTARRWATTPRVVVGAPRSSRPGDGAQRRGKSDDVCSGDPRATLRVSPLRLFARLERTPPTYRIRAPTSPRRQSPIAARRQANDLQRKSVTTLLVGDEPVEQIDVATQQLLAPGELADRWTATDAIPAPTPGTLSPCDHAPPNRRENRLLVLRAQHHDAAAAAEPLPSDATMTVRGFTSASRDRT